MGPTGPAGSGVTINDLVTNLGQTWSSQKIALEIALAAVNPENGGFVVVSDTIPDPLVPNTLWVDSQELALYVIYDDGINVAAVELVGGSGSGNEASFFFISEDPPDPLVENTLWLDTTDFALYVIYNDGTNIAPVQVVGGTGGTGGGDLSTANSPAANEIARFTTPTTVEGLSYEEFKTALGLVIGSDIQAYSAILAATTAAFTAAMETKLSGISPGADVTNSTTVNAAGALMESEVSANLKTLTLPASTTISAFAATLLDDADAASARTTLGVPSAVDAAITALKATLYVVNVHGATAGTARITGYAGNIWYGSVHPTNAVSPDIVIRTDEAV
jgi:hypothetical protein